MRVRLAVAVQAHDCIVQYRVRHALALLAGLAQQPSDLTQDLVTPLWHRGVHVQEIQHACLARAG